MKRAILPILAALFLGACGGGREVRKGPPPPSPLCKAIIRTAKTWLPEEEKNRPTPKDCSDYVGKVFAENGIKLPRTSEAMSIEGEDVGSARQLRMGDLVFFAGRNGGRKIGHVGIYVNNGIFIHQANPGEGVRQESLHSDYWRKRWLRARRIAD
ncbi:MAG: C40 family peptidase [Elusimicrobiota bacterium]|nr:MAG: C40 family peptidase [Elusimicrobiota bacterium]